MVHHIMTKYKPGDKVLIVLPNKLLSKGEVTIVRNDEPIYRGYLYKVLPDDSDFEYDYYKEDELEPASGQ